MSYEELVSYDVGRGVVRGAVSYDVVAAVSYEVCRSRRCRRRLVSIAVLAASTLSAATPSYDAAVLTSVCTASV